MSPWRGRASALGLGVMVGIALAWQAWHRPAPTPVATAWVDQIREVVRLETLDVTVHKKIIFTPDPEALTGTWRDVVAWAASTFNPKEGKVIAFAVCHLGVDLQQWGAGNFLAEGSDAYVALPPLQVQVELLPAETEVIGSNLDSAQTMALLERARTAFAQDIMSNPRLRDKAVHATQRAVAELLLSAGFAHVHFVDALPPQPNTVSGS